MTIRVLMFAALAQRTGSRDVSIEMREPATVGDALAELRRRYPVLAEFDGKLAAAVNSAYARSDNELKDGDELALIPPVSGG